MMITLISILLGTPVSAAAPPRHLGVSFMGQWPANINPRKNGAFVRYVIPGGAASKAGMRHGDVITRIGQTAVQSGEEALEAWRLAADQQCVVIELLRDGLPQEIPCLRPSESESIDWDTALAPQYSETPTMTLLGAGNGPELFDVTDTPPADVLRGVALPDNMARACVTEMMPELKSPTRHCVAGTDLLAHLPEHRSIRVELELNAPRSDQYLRFTSRSELQYRALSPDGKALLVGKDHAKRVASLVPLNARVGTDGDRLVSVDTRCATLRAENGVVTRICLGPVDAGR